MGNSEWEERLRRHREEKDNFFAESPRSPIPPQERMDFEGLNYYPPDPSYRFELELHEHEEKEKLRIEVTGGGEREYLRWGEFRFEMGGEEQVVQAYKSDPQEEKLFVPFRDATNGKETYGAGRYLDLGEDECLEEGKWILDFNEAYNPWCAYSEAYSCPLTPPENWLEVPVRAGEKIYSPQG
ncbi:hypothetical protein AKJ57_04850 [candidate division MSBL1 archaeon SCGC-AAA259A05]|uniref:DUF1684 domain-containing protein n=1 Tax=candidate division MSBL1 archaeon SCGC-AAA259A05 TaxID=1698259 RepID=A0A133U6L3_9EURY|nr:hypothetical protein AKJ57_04850 [candidate division MSBL1 archaeon SCGC-AAA259A05]